MRKKLLKRIAVLVAPIIWRKIRGRRGHHRHRAWYRRPHHFGYGRGYGRGHGRGFGRGRGRRRIWL